MQLLVVLTLLRVSAMEHMCDRINDTMLEFSKIFCSLSRTEPHFACVGVSMADLPASDPCNVVGVSNRTTAAKVPVAYRTLVPAWHPDELAGRRKETVCKASAA